MFKKIQFYFKNNFTEFIATIVLSGMLLYYSALLLWPLSGTNQSTNISIAKGSTLIDIASELVNKPVSYTHLTLPTTLSV